MPMLTIRLFGKFCMQYDHQVMHGLDSRKAQELLCYLLLYHNRSHPRDLLSSLLWGDCPTPQSKTYLRKALWQLQCALTLCAEAGCGQLLTVETDVVRIDLRPTFQVDVAMFEAACASAQSVPGSELDLIQYARLQEAVELYHADLLEGWYQDWCLFERERLQLMYLAALEKLMGYCEVHREYDTGMVYGTKILRCDRARESCHRRLMRLQFFAGDRIAALRQFERCVAALKGDFDVGPDEDTIELWEQIRENRLDHAAPGFSGAPGAPSPASSSLLQIVERLKQFQTLLSVVQEQVRQDIQMVEQLMRSRY
jgi:DNA-binding SARP family transcriptional activator